MLALSNHSPFEAMIFAAADLCGVDSLIVVIKASFVLGAPPSVAERQRPILLADAYWGDPVETSLRYPGELHLPKPATDVVVIGDACAPGGRAVERVDVGLRVGSRCKYARVHGERRWAPGYRVVQPCRAQPFERMPIVYERAYGGVEEPRNPVGRGALGSRDPAELVGQPVPNIDDPHAPLLELGQRPQPAGFGAIAPSWSPRVELAGTYDARWSRTRAPFLPEDFDPRFAQVAAPDLRFEPPLVGGEPIVLLGFDPERTWELHLPRCRFDLRARVAGERQPLQPSLDLVLIEPTARHLSLTWRAILAVGDALLRVEAVELILAQLDGAGTGTGA